MIDYLSQRVESPEVYLSKENSLSICSSDIHNLINIAEKLPRNRVRFCLHSSSDETVHEMFIVHPKEAYVRPHKHINKPESMLIIEGEADYVVFDDEGNIKEKISMGDYRSGKSFYQSARAEQFHSLVIHSKWLVFLEVTQGPFNKKDTVFAEWSPKGNENGEIIEFMKKIEEVFK